MQNRIVAYLNEPEETRPAGDYFVLVTECAWFYLSREVARRVERQLDRLWPPRWITFTDLTGARVRVLASQVQSLCESTSGQRAADRAFRRTLQQEEKADRQSWEDEE